MKKGICIALATVLLLWLIIVTVDFVRVHHFEKPMFCIGTKIADDGGSGRYSGLGYSVDIEGNFMPDDPFPGVVEFRFCLFGILVEAGTRD